MEYNLGNKLKSLRKKYDLTQEQLAERLGVSFQAISKWETNAAVPDVTMFPILANFYRVSTDELLGVDITRSEEKIEQYHKDVYALHSEWKLVEAVELARRACAEFPGSDNLRFLLAHCLHQAQNVFRTKEENLREAEEILNKILETSTNTGLRLSCASKLAIYAHNLGNDEKALEYANTLPTLFQTRTYQIGRYGLKKGEKRFPNARMNIRQYMEAIRWVIEDTANAEDTGLMLEDRIAILDSLLDLQKLVYGEDLLVYNFDAVVYSYTKAALYCRMNEPDAALDELEKAWIYAEKFRDYDEDACFTSILQKGEKTLPRSHWSQSSFADLHDEFEGSGKDKYSLLHGNPRFEALRTKIAELAE